MGPANFANYGTSCGMDGRVHNSQLWARTIMCEFPAACTARVRRKKPELPRNNSSLALQLWVDVFFPFPFFSSPSSAIH